MNDTIKAFAEFEVSSGVECDHRQILKDIARVAVDAIVEDLSDRHGLSQEWELIDEETKIGIVLTWRTCVVLSIEKSEDEDAAG